MGVTSLQLEGLKLRGSRGFVVEKFNTFVCLLHHQTVPPVTPYSTRGPSVPCYISWT